MRSIMKITFISLTLIWSLQVSSQNIEKLISEADYTLYKESFDKAYEQYENIHLLYPDEEQILYHKEIAYHLTEGRGTSLDNLLSFEDTKGVSDKFYNYWLGRVYFGRYEFEKARTHFKAFLDIKAYKSSTIINETKVFMRRIDKAMDRYNDPNYYEIEPIGGGVNSKYADISPAFFGDNDELLFASSRASNDPKNPEFKIYHSTKSGITWSSPTEVSALGTFEKQNAKVEVVDKQGKLFIFKENGGGDLYYSTPNGNGWTKPEEFDSKIKKSLVESHFFISDDEDHILFASDKGGKGLDIYESFINRSTGEWSDPKPVKGGVNSDYNEDSPFISHDGNYLYFSSDRPGSTGGMDIYRSKYDSQFKRWTKAENIGFPVNTIDDEINFQLNPDGKTGYFSSNRLHGEGDYDIYYFHEIQKLLATGNVYDENGQVVSNAVVKFHPKRYEDESFTSEVNESGEYNVNLIAKEEFNVEVLIEDQVVFNGYFESKTSDFNNPIGQDFHITLPKEKVQKVDYASLFENKKENEVTTLDMLGNKFSVGKKVVINNIYFAFESDDIIVDNDHVVDHIYDVLVKNPKLQIEIGGHTDNVGTTDFNKELSLRRAKKIASMLTAKGIDTKRLVPVGYGESQPLASNDDEADGREINRRIEIKAIEADGDQLYTNIN